MRYLVHSEDATFDATTGKYMFYLDRRIANPYSITISKANFVAATASSYPQVVYLRSSKISQLILTKHTVELKDDGHEDSSDVLATLPESHTLGRYGTEKSLTFPFHSNTPLRKIDFFFTANRTLMPGEIQPGGGGVPGAADDATIVAIGSKVVLWVDFSDFDNILSTSYSPITGTGDKVAYIQNKFPGTTGLFFTSIITAGVPELELASFGNTYGLTGVAGQTWVKTSDNTANNPEFAMPFTLFLMFRVPPTSQLVHLFQQQELFELELTASNTLKYKTWENGAHSTREIQATTFVPNTFWFLECMGEDTNGDGNIQLYWTFRNLVTGVEYTEDNTPGLGDNTIIWNTWAFSKANSHFAHIQSHCIMYTDNDASDRAIIKTWMLAKYGVDEGVQETPVVAEDASFFVELEIKSRNQ